MPRAMRRGERRQSLRRNERRTLRRDHLLAREEPPERLAAKKLHHQKRLVAVFLRVLKIRHLDDVRMTERRDDLGFTSKSFELLAIFGESRVENFHGDTSTEILLHRRVHDAHPTFAEWLEQSVSTPDDAPLQRTGVSRSSALHLMATLAEI